MVSINASPYLTLGFVLLLVLAGCTGGDVHPAQAGTTALTAPDAEFDETTGAITGTLLSTEFQPIAGAEVGIPQLAVSVQTALDGAFTLSHLAPGEYILQAIALGFGPGQKTVKVEAGKSADGSDIQLEPLPVVVPYATVDQFQGLITCSVGTVGVLSEECGAGLGTPVGRYGTNSRNQIDWTFNVTSLDARREIYLELTWVPASAAAKMLGFNVAHDFSCNPDCGAKRTFDGCAVFKNYGPPVMKCDIKMAVIAGDVKDPAKDLPYDITARAWAAPTKATEQPTIVFEQPFTMYRTYFYDMMKPGNYTAVPAN